MKHFTPLKSVFFAFALSCSFLFMSRTIAQNNGSLTNIQTTSINANQTIVKSKTTISTDTAWVDAMLDPNVNFYEAQATFYRYWQGKTPDKGKGYKVFKRWENFMTPRVYPTGIRPTQEIIAQEYDKFVKAYPIAKPTTKSALGMWSLIGPNGAPGGSVPNGPYMSPAGAGRVNCIRFNPLKSQNMWLGTPSGGAWRSYNGGTTWSPATDNTLSMGVSDIAIASDTNIIYLATGDADAGDTYSIGIMKSTDAGATWQVTSFSFGVTSGIRIFKLYECPLAYLNKNKYICRLIQRHESA